MGAWLESVRSSANHESIEAGEKAQLPTHTALQSAHILSGCAYHCNELQVAYLVLPGAANNSSISARSKNSTVRRTQRLPEIAKILWQRSMGVVSVFRLPANPQCMHCVVFSRFLVQL